MTGVIGLDLSLTGTGVCNADGQTHLIKSSGHKGDTLYQRHERLTEILTRISRVAQPAPNDLVVIEAPSFGSVGGSSHDRSGLWWLVTSHMLAIGCHVIAAPPKTAKKYITGKGDAGKGAISMHLLKRFGVEIENDNLADAFGLRALGLDLLGHPLADMPALNRSALDKLTVPAGAVR